MDEATTSVETINKGSRKKQRHERKAKQVRHDKYKDKDPLCINFSVTCRHKPTSKFKCAKLRENDIVRNRKLLYNNKDKTHQDIYLCRLITAFKPHRTSSSTTAKPKPRNFSTNFYLLNNKKKVVRVCKAMFMKAFDLGRKRLNTICKRIVEGMIPTETRGGDRKSHKSLKKKESVCDFIKKLQAKESHYARNKSCRIYLSCELNMTTLWKLCNNSVSDELKVKKWFFRHIFLTNFNIGFSSPASDACSTCTLLSNKIKGEQDPQKRQYFMTEKRIHKLRANMFYQLGKQKKDNTNTYYACFDLQQVMPLPKTPIQDSFYARQISFYNFCIVGMDGIDPDFYCWTENMAGRGSTEVGSALLDHLNSIKDKGSLKDVKSIHLFCDGCGGQNKNSFIVYILMYWLVKHSPASLFEILLVYPVRGHSFLPADRVFGRVEKDFRKVPVVKSKEHYKEIISRHGKLHFLGEDWKYYDVKNLEKYFRKIDGMRDLKRIFIQKKIVRNKVDCAVKTFQNYKFQNIEEEKPRSLLKRGITFSKVKLMEKELGHFIKGKKKKDVEGLLEKQFGENWKEEPQLQWYLELLYEANDNEDSNENEECDCLESDCGDLHV